MKFTTIFTFLLVLTVSTLTAQQNAEPEYGMAMIYDDDFEGMRLKSGEYYDKTKRTASHPHFPIGSIVKVYCTSTKKTTYVKINDRGPYLKGFVTELSKRAATELGIVGKKKAVVKLTFMRMAETEMDQTLAMNTHKGGDVPPSYDKMEEKPKPASKPDDVVDANPTEEATISGSGSINLNPQRTSTYYSMYKVKVEDVGGLQRGFGVQIGKYSEYYKLLKQVSILQKKGVRDVMVGTIKEGGKDYYKIIVGPYTSRKTADEVKSKLKKRGLKGFVITM